MIRISLRTVVKGRLNKYAIDNGVHVYGIPKATLGIILAQSKIELEEMVSNSENVEYWGIDMSEVVVGGLVEYVNEKVA